MGIIGNGTKKGHDNQKASLLKELAGAGLTVKNIEEVEVETNKTKSALGSSLKAFTGGKLTPDFYQVFLLENHGRDELYIQPYSGMVVLPGEHHVIVEGALSSAIALTNEAIFGGPSWKTADRDKALEKELNKENPQLKYISKRCQFEWAIGMSKIEHEWTVQVYPIRSGLSHIVMQAGRYGGFTTYEVGFKVFSALVGQFSAMLHGKAGQTQSPIYSIPYFMFADKMMLEDILPDPIIEEPVIEEKKSVDVEATPQESISVEELLKNSATPFAAKKVMVSSIPEKKERNIRKHVMPASAQSDEIIVAFDLTLFGSAKDAVVFTKSHCYVKEIDVQYTIPYADLIAVKGLKGALSDKLELQLSHKTITIPIGNHEEALPKVFEAIAPQN